MCVCVCVCACMWGAVSGTRPSEKWKEGPCNRPGRKYTIWIVISVNYLPANVCLEDFYRPHSGCTLLSGKRLTVGSKAALQAAKRDRKTEEFSN